MWLRAAAMAWAMSSRVAEADEVPSSANIYINNNLIFPYLQDMYLFMYISNKIGIPAKK
jgi:hypothetical protein